MGRRIAVNPRGPGTLALHGEWAGFWRIRVAGVYRVLYVIDDPAHVLVTKIGPRGTVYRRP